VPPTIKKIVETSLYVKDLKESEEFYTGVLGLEVVARKAGRHVFIKAGRNMLLLFSPEGLRREHEELGDRAIPQVYERGRTHIAFEVNEEDMPRWKETLGAKKVPIEFAKNWPAGNRSYYFRDPDQNVVELITPGSWPIAD
jgi:catechol 2,3-dioxygenase-like lactoylglutathione lyase family enzyme